VGVDGSSSSRRGLEWAILLAAKMEAELVVVHAVGLLAHLGSGAPVPSGSHREELRQAFESDWCAPLRGSGVTYRLRFLDGSPVPVLLGAAEEEHVDLIVLGTRGLGGFPGLLLGSTSLQMAEHAARPVLIVPPDPQE
jgi:nucleotide-binding universal stress UspA family protein